MDEQKQQILEILIHNKGFAHPEKWINYGIDHNFKEVKAEKLEECPDCSARILNFIGQFIYYSTLVKLQSCSQCGLVFSDIRIDPMVIQSHFELAYKDESYFLHRRRSIFHQISKLVGRFAPHNGKILDVGGAKGHLLAVLKQNRPDLNLVLNDISKDACDYALSQFGLNTICGDVNALERHITCFDVVIMSDVVYYEPELQKLWELLPRIVSKNSVVILRVPNKIALIRFWQFITRFIGRNIVLEMQDRIKYFNPEHLYVFSRRYMLTRLKKIGFSEVTIIPSELLKQDQCDLLQRLYYYFSKVVSMLSCGKLVITPSILVIAKNHVQKPKN